MEGSQAVGTAASGSGVLASAAEIVVVVVVVVVVATVVAGTDPPPQAAKRNIPPNAAAAKLANGRGLVLLLLTAIPPFVCAIATDRMSVRRAAEPYMTGRLSPIPHESSGDVTGLRLWQDGRVSHSNMPAAEVAVTPALVRTLLESQHPDVAALPISELANGWDNVIYRLGDSLTVRLPRRAMAARLIDHEQAALPALAECLPISIPAPLRVGRPELGYPWSWSVNPWIPGTTAATTPFTDPTREAQRLGEFMAALHTTAPVDAPPNPYRGHFIGRNTAVNVERSAQLDWGDQMLVRWHELVEVEPWAHAPVWIHGDIHAANMLVDHGEISGVIDFGDVCAGDPATDLSVAWALFDEADRNIFRDAASDGEHPIDDATWQRAEAWALHFAVVYTLHSADNPVMGAIGAQLRHVLIE